MGKASLTTESLESLVNILEECNVLDSIIVLTNVSTWDPEADLTEPIVTVCINKFLTCTSNLKLALDTLKLVYGSCNEPRGVSDCSYSPIFIQLCSNHSKHFYSED